MTSAHFDLKLAMQFIVYCSIARPTIVFEGLPAGASEESPPDTLPDPVCNVLSSVLSISTLEVIFLWSLYKAEVWASQVRPSEDHIRLYNEAGLAHHLSYRPLYPPTRFCTTEGCTYSQRRATKRYPRAVTLYTLREGALNTFSTSFFCESCRISYHPNYKVHNLIKSRIYYDRVGPPLEVEVSRSCYMDIPLLEVIGASKCHAWVSAMNCARIYNTTMAHTQCHVVEQWRAYRNIIDPPSAPPLPEEALLNGFFLYSLLLHHAEHDTILTLPDDCPQRDRLKEPLQHQNKLSEGIGQEEYTHVCDECRYTYTRDGEKVKVSAIVTDGVTIGHPCCSVHGCPEPLEKTTHRFCPEHSHTHGNICAIKGCTATSRADAQTCNDPLHMEQEARYREKGTSFFTLKRKAERARARNASTSAPQQDACSEKDPTGNKSFKSQFARARSHNEQIIHRPCGMIVSRMTCFGSEALSHVYKYLKLAFPTEAAAPEAGFYDSGCLVEQHRRKLHPDHLRHMAIPVDVFHFKSKHSEAHTECQNFCNPALFPELYTEDHKWRFNTSVAEENNSWIAAFEGIVRNMEATRYNFYLDEMIKRRNRWRVQQLGLKGTNPGNIPITVFLAGY